MTDYHWTPINQRSFLETLAETGSVDLACKEVAMSRRAAYNLRGRRDGAAFKIGWDAALLQASAVVWGILMDRAINGQMVETVRDPETHTTQRMHYNGQMGLALLARLEAKAKSTDDAGPYSTAVRMVDSDFAAFLDLIEAGGAGAQAGLFVAARVSPEEMVFPGISDALDNLQNQCELARISEGSGDVDDDAERAECDAEESPVWFDDERHEWRTSFPPPPGLNDHDENGEFGDVDYDRSLSEAEVDAIEAKRAIEIAPLVESGAIERDSWFGFTPEPIEMKCVQPAVVIAPEPAVTLPEPVTVEADPEQAPKPVVIPNANLRTIHCEPQLNYPARGIIPPWAERIC